MQLEREAADRAAVGTSGRDDELAVLRQLYLGAQVMDEYVAYWVGFAAVHDREPAPLECLTIMDVLAREYPQAQFESGANLLMEMAQRAAKGEAVRPTPEYNLTNSF